MKIITFLTNCLKKKYKKIKFGNPVRKQLLRTLVTNNTIFKISFPKKFT